MLTLADIGFEAPAALLRYIAPKGSICVDGVSLTVNGVDAHGFDVNLVPHTLAHTAFGASATGTPAPSEPATAVRASSPDNTSSASSSSSESERESESECVKCVSRVCMT